MFVAPAANPFHHKQLVFVYKYGEFHCRRCIPKNCQSFRGLHQSFLCRYFTKSWSKIILYSESFRGLQQSFLCRLLNQISVCVDCSQLFRPNPSILVDRRTRNRRFWSIFADSGRIYCCYPHQFFFCGFSACEIKSPTLSSTSGPTNAFLCTGWTVLGTI